MHWYDYTIVGLICTGIGTMLNAAEAFVIGLPVCLVGCGFCITGLVVALSA